VKKKKIGKEKETKEEVELEVMNDLDVEDQHHQTEDKTRNMDLEVKVKNFAHIMNREIFLSLIHKAYTDNQQKLAQTKKFPRKKNIQPLKINFRLKLKVM